MEKNDNPASRLLKIMYRANELGKGLPNAPIQMVWGKIFGIGPKDTLRIYYHLFQLNTLIVEIRSKIEKIVDIDSELYLKHLGHIERMLLSPNLSARWAEMYSRIPGEAFYSLEVCSNTLSKFYKEKEIDEKELKGLRDDVDKLNEKVLSSDSLNEELKILILDQLELIRRAISEYSIRGTAGLKESLTRSIGEIVINNSLFDQNAKESEEGKGFLKVLGSLNRLIDKSYEKAIDMGADKFLGLLQGAMPS